MKFLPDYLSCLSILVIMTAAVDGEVEQQQVKTKMEKNEVVPDVLPSAPESLLEVTYGARKVNLGTILSTAAVAKAPQVFWNGDDDSFYTLCMIDPDAPSRTQPRAREWEHWLVGNIPGDKIEKGEVLCSYAGATPPAGTGLHRYVLVLYKQPGKLKFDESPISGSGGKRAKFSVTQFASKYNLGDPIAGNFFLAKSS